MRALVLQAQMSIGADDIAGAIDGLDEAACRRLTTAAATLGKRAVWSTP
jgi:hypothetical protein